MNILCDTCSVLMLLRIAPDMFTNPEFECVTITEVRNELFKTQKFKTKYPWKNRYKANIRTLPETDVKNSKFELYLATINATVESGTINKKTNKYFGISRVDKIIAASALANDYEVTTGDKDLIDFLSQEFDKKNNSPLRLINLWLTKKLIIWNDRYQEILEDWAKSEEAPQPRTDIKTFEDLTGFTYAGT